jgi:sporadic carbohydrate cluster protein (TIGR04323 family)
MTKRQDFASVEYGIEECMIDNFQNKTLNYDLKKYPWHEWIKSTIQELHPEVNDLSRMHEAVSPEQARKVRKHVQKSFLGIHYQKAFEEFAKEYGEQLIGTTEYLIKRQPTLNLVVPDQAKKHRRLPFHQGIWYNNGTGMRTIWMPLTLAYGTNSMYIVDHNASKRISEQTIENCYSQEEFEELCIKEARPVELEPGQAHLFHQEHLHGNINNTTGKTRLAIDWHLLPKGLPHGRRLPGGFFKLPGDYVRHRIFPSGRYIAYVGNNTVYDKNIPLHYQRNLMDQYCNDNNIQHAGYQFENEHLHWMPILEHYIDQKPSGIIMNSIYSLPDNVQRRNALIEKALEKNVIMIFSNELLIVKTRKDAEKIKKYFEYYVSC